MRPEYLLQGELATLFPVLATTSKEGRTTSILLACMSQIDEFAANLLLSTGLKVGNRGKVQCFTETVFKTKSQTVKDRPDGLIIVRNGAKEWRALVEAKIGNAELNADQIEKYRAVAKEQKIDAVITISNQFAIKAENHPLEEVRKSRSNVPVFHWSWMSILTTTHLLLNNDLIADRDQGVLLNELRRFLSHESTGIKGFERMPTEWVDLNRLVASGNPIPIKSNDTISVLQAWHQETRDLSLILSRLTEAVVSENLPRKHKGNLAERQKYELAALREANQLKASFSIPNSASELYVTADLVRRTINVAMTVRAPEDKKSSKARLNWLLKQIKGEAPEDLNIRLLWPGRSEPTFDSVINLREGSEKAFEGKNDLQVHSFEIFVAKRTGARFAQRANFIEDLEQIVPEFYEKIGQNLSNWQKPAPKIKSATNTAEEVSVKAISEFAQNEVLDHE